VTLRNSRQSELFLSAAIFAATEIYIWLAAAGARWTIVFPIALLLLLWRKQSQSAASLGLRFTTFVQSFRQWYALWIPSVALFLFLGRHILFHRNVVVRGCVYFVWCALQQALYQSVIWGVVRKSVNRRWPAAILAGLLFALLHAPNPVLMLGTLLWGIASSLLFENCRTVIGLALLQVMFSSMLLWETSYPLNRGFRTGPAYYRAGRAHFLQPNLQLTSKPSRKRQRPDLAFPPNNRSPRPITAKLLAVALPLVAAPV